jgi:hypothetical protein
MDIEADKDIITVYSGDLMPDDPDTAPASATIPLAKLAPKQAIKSSRHTPSWARARLT